VKAACPFKRGCLGLGIHDGAGICRQRLPRGLGWRAGGRPDQESIGMNNEAAKTVARVWQCAEYKLTPLLHLPTTNSSPI
jgi:hypothetical protein